MSQTLDDSSVMEAKVETVPFPLAIIDEAGTIVQTSEAWRSVARDNGTPMEAVTAGCNYLDAIDPEGHPSARRAQDGIQAVLSGESERFRTDYPCHSPGEFRWFRMVASASEIRGDRYGKIGHIDITDQKSNERELQRRVAYQERMVEQANYPVGVYSSGGEIIQVNESMSEIFGVDDPEEVEGRSLLEFIAPEDQELGRDQMRQSLQGDPSSPETYRVVGEAGAERYVKGSGVPILWKGQQAAVVFGTDVTSENIRETGFERLHEMAIDIFEVETVAGIAERTVAVIEDLFPVSYTIVFRFDRENGVLQPVQVDRPGVDVDRVDPVDPGEGVVGEAFVDGEATFVDDGTVLPSVSDLDHDGGPVRVVPLEGEGVLVVGFLERGSPSDDTVELTDALAETTAEAILKLRLESHIRSTQEQADAVKSRSQRLSNDLDLANETVSAIVSGDTRAEIERSVCETLVGAREVKGAWIGEQNVVTDSIERRVGAGTATTLVESAEYPLDSQSSPKPPVRALHDMEPVLYAIDESEWVDRTTEWARRLRATDVLAVYSVPLGDEATTHGVLTVFLGTADPGDRFLETIRTVADTVGYAIDSVERKQALGTNEVFEATFRGSSPDCVVQGIATALEAEVSAENYIAGADNTVTAFVTIYGSDPGAVRSLPSHVDQVLAVELLEQRSTDRIKARIELTGPFVGTVLSGMGATTSEITADGSSVRVVVTISDADQVRSIKELLENHLSSVQLVSKRQVDNGGGTASGGLGTFMDQLTGRQQEVFQTAYHAGYFESPRDTTGEEVAEVLGISSQAFYQHIRTIQRKLARTVVETDSVE